MKAGQMCDKVAFHCAVPAIFQSGSAQRKERAVTALARRCRFIEYQSAWRTSSFQSWSCSGHGHGGNHFRTEAPDTLGRIIAQRHQGYNRPVHTGVL